MRKIIALIALLAVIVVGAVPNIADSIFPLDDSPGHATLASNALHQAARAVLSEADRFEPDDSVREAWEYVFKRVERSDASARFPCMKKRMCGRDEWYVYAIRHVGTLAFASGSKEPIAKWVQAIRNATDDLSRCRAKNLCKDEAGALLMIVRAHPDL